MPASFLYHGTLILTYHFNVRRGSEKSSMSQKYAVCTYIFCPENPSPGLGVVTCEMWPGSEGGGKSKQMSNKYSNYCQKYFIFKQRGIESANKQETLQGFVVQRQGIVQTNVSHVILKQSRDLHGLPSQHWGVGCLSRKELTSSLTIKGCVRVSVCK